jgi:hypothetical protein
MSPAPQSRSSRRISKTAGILLVLLVVAGTVTFLSRGGDGTPLNPIAQAAALTEQSSGARISFDGTMQQSSLPQPVPMSGDGVLDQQANRSRMSITMFMPKGEVDMEAIGDGSKAYLKSALFEHLPDGDEWIGYDTALGTSSETAFGTSSNPSEQLDLLRGVSDEFRALDKRTIRGVSTTGYRATLDFDHYVDYLRSKGANQAADAYERVAEVAPTTAEIETWIDDEKLVRRIKVTTHTHDSHSDDTSSTKMTMDFYDFGISPQIQLPDSSTVYDITPAIRAKLGLDNSD